MSQTQMIEERAAELRALDAGVATEVMGRDPSNVVLAYSTLIECAWGVVEEMQERGYSYTLLDVAKMSSVMRWPRAGFIRSVYPPVPGREGDSFWVDGHTMPEAICRAALLAVRASGQKKC